MHGVGTAEFAFRRNGPVTGPYQARERNLQDNPPMTWTADVGDIAMTELGASDVDDGSSDLPDNEELNFRNVVNHTGPRFHAARWVLYVPTAPNNIIGGTVPEFMLQHAMALGEDGLKLLGPGHRAILHEKPGEMGFYIFDSQWLISPRFPLAGEDSLAPLAWGAYERYRYVSFFDQEIKQKKGMMERYLLGG